MPASFLKLPRELRDRVYTLCLLHQGSITIRPGTDHFRRRVLTPKLLLANKIIYQEASFLLYSQNRFDFTMATRNSVISFLETIGSNNAGCIRQAYVNFPTFHYLDPGDITLEDDSINILTSIQRNCTKLRTLIISPHSTYVMERRLDALDYPKIAVGALELVDTHFRAMESLREIVVEVYEDAPSGYIRRKMETLGWVLSLMEDEEDDDDEDYETGSCILGDRLQY